jgi:hypothetical protein
MIVWLSSSPPDMDIQGARLWSFGPDDLSIDVMSLL